MIYLASPYWHEDPMIRDIRARENADVAMRLALRGVMAYAPLVHGHNIAALDPFHDISELYWLEHGLMMLRQCNYLWVIDLAGWDKSRGVATEVLEAEMRLQIPVELLDPLTLTVSGLPEAYSPVKVYLGKADL
jgi:hypothetical protein